MHILIVDDNAMNVALIRKVLDKIGCVSQVYTDPKAGLLAASTGEFDAVLIDYVMPTLDGLSFVRAFRAMPAGAETPVMMVTSADDAYTRELARSAGVTEFLAKPIDPVDLRARVKNLIDAYHAGADLSTGTF
jgi:putative two-component system response regulator